MGPTTTTRPQAPPASPRRTLRPGGRVLLALLALLLTQIQLPVAQILCTALGFLINPILLGVAVAGTSFYLFVTRRSTR